MRWPCRHILGPLLVAFLNSLSGCNTHFLPAIQYSPAKVLHGALNGQPIDHVVIFAVDGLEQGALVHYLTMSPPRRPGGLHDLFGVYVDGDALTFTKGMAVHQPTTVFPSYTYPAWTSAFTGVFPGAHGIAGNSVFFRDRQVTRYYTEYHIDAAKVQLGKGFLSGDISDQVKTLYEYVRDRGGQSIVVHHMLTRGSGEGTISADLDTLLSYTQNRNYAVDENALWEAVHALQGFNAGREGADLQLPSVMTIYFAGLDHAEHLSPDKPEEARLEYLQHVDDLIAKFIAGDSAIIRNHHATPTSALTPVDPIPWRGLRNEPVMQRTLFVLLSDHGHTPIDWDKAVGIDDLQVVVKELADITGKPYRLENPALIEETIFSKVRVLFGLLSDGTISKDSNIVATLNGGALGVHVKPMQGKWKDNPDYDRDVAPILGHLLLTLHKNGLAPEAVLYKRESRYVFIPYTYDGATVQLLPALDIDRSPLNSTAYPMAMRRLNGLALRLPTDPRSAPDFILLADRSKQLTYFNKPDARVLEQLDVTKHRHYHSDHGHLSASDSFVPIIFVLGSQEALHMMNGICEASLVDVTPTLLDILGLLPSFTATVGNHSEEVKGHSLKPALEHILTQALPLDGENVCAPAIPAHIDQKIN